jgi:hypothetical protein
MDVAREDISVSLQRMFYAYLNILQVEILVAGIQGHGQRGAGSK